MTCMLRNAAISAVAALTLGAGVTTTATPSMAQGWQGHGWHGGGWRGGYWRGRALVRRRLGRTGRSGRPRRPRARRARRIGLCFYGPVYYGRCYWQNQPAYDGWGNFAGYQPVQVCY
jgi:hypothetical protein